MSSHPEPRLTDVQRTVLAITLVPLFMSLLSVSIVNVVLPSIEIGLGASASGLQWVLTGYTLAFGVVLVAAGRAGDLFGRAPMFVAGVALFGLSSLVAGFAPNEVVLNIARVVMGFGSGFLNPQTVGLIQQYFQGAQRGRAFGLFGAVVGISVAIGPVLGGVLVALLGADWGWRSSFLINVPFAVVSILFAVRSLPRSAWRALPEADPTPEEAAGAPPGPQASAPGPDTPAAGEPTSPPAGSAGRPRAGRPDLDPVGMMLLALGTLAVMIPFLQFSAGPWVWSILGLGVLLVVAWVRWEAAYKRRGRAPMVDLRLFATRSFANGSLLIALYFMGMTSVWVVGAIFLQSGLGRTALEAGLVGLPAAILSALSSAVAGRHVFRIGRPIVLGGIAILLLGLVTSIIVVVLHDRAGTSIWWLLLTLSFVGLGQGATISPNQTLTLADVPLRYAGSAGGVLQTGQRIGTAIGLALITAVFFAAQAAAGWTAAFVWAYLVIIVIVAASGVVGVVDQVQARRAGRSPAA